MKEPRTRIDGQTDKVCYRRCGVDAKTILWDSNFENISAKADVQVMVRVHTRTTKYTLTVVSNMLSLFMTLFFVKLDRCQDSS